MATRVTTLTEVQFTDIIQISHIEARLKRNFEVIVEELQKQNEDSSKKDNEIRELREVIELLKEKTEGANTREEMARLMAELKRQIMEEVIERDTAIKSQIQNQITLESQKNIQNANNANNTLEEMQKEIDSLKSRLELHKKANQSRDQSVETLTKEIQGLKQELNRQNMNFQEELARQGQVFQEQIDRLDKALIQQPHTATISAIPSQASTRRAYDSQKDLRTTTHTSLPSSAQDDLSSRVGVLQQRLSELSDHLREKDKVIQTHTKEIWDLNQKTFSVERTHDIDHVKVKQELDAVRKQIEEKTAVVVGTSVNQNTGENLKQQEENNTKIRDVERKIQLLLQSHDMMNKNIKGCEDQIDTIVTHLNTSINNTDTHQTVQKEGQPKEYAKSEGNNSDLKRELLLKINDQRKEYMTILKGMINSNKKTQNNEQLNRYLEDTINQLKVNVNKKADQQTTKKAVVFLQKKINYIFNTFLNLTEEDARIGKKSWFCLSCDRRLNNFTGKLGEHIPHNALKGSKLSSSINLQKHIINVESPVRRYNSRSKLDLPTIQPPTTRRT